MTLSGKPYVPAIDFMRTDAERRDPVLAWTRSDTAFFASGACHILAHGFLARDRAQRFAGDDDLPSRRCSSSE